MNSAMFLFPGQGSQSVGMLADVYTQHPKIKQTFVEASDALGYDIWKMVMDGPVEQLNSTENTQPAILTASIAIWRLLENNIETPQYLAGHSLGEYSALVAANVISFSDAVKLVFARGEFMQQAVAEGEGAMAAIIGLDDASIESACELAQQSEVVSPVNYNSPGQVVIAGHKAAVERAMENCKAAGAKRALPLPVSVPSHCSLMKPAAEKLKQMLESINFNVPDIAVINNVDVAVENQPDSIKLALVKQLFMPVRWSDIIVKADNMGVENYYECGPGKVLTGLNKRIIKGSSCIALTKPEEITNILL
jgi:[acyl-carrier-protein] S-malonyltransferase